MCIILRAACRLLKTESKKVRHTPWKMKLHPSDCSRIVSEFESGVPGKVEKLILDFTLVLVEVPCTEFLTCAV